MGPRDPVPRSAQRRGRRWRGRDLARLAADLGGDDRGAALEPRGAEWAAQATNEAWKAGVSITAGTDSIGVDQEGTLPNLQEELRLLVEQAGLTPLAAITAATLNGARAIGIEATHGSIATGKVADLVVLSADPSADIRHTRDIVYVFREGRRLEPLNRPQPLAGKR